MWSDDLESPATTSFRNGTGDNSGTGSGIGNADSASHSPHPQMPWMYNSTTTPQNGSSRSSDMEVEEDTAPAAHQQSAPLTGYFMNDYLSGDDDRIEELDDSLDDLSDGGANLDILAVTDVLTMGMDIADHFTDMPGLVPASDGHALSSISPALHTLHETLAHFPVTNGHGTPAPAFEPPLTPPVHVNMPPYVPQQATPFNHQFAVHILAHNMNPNAASNPNATALSPENYDLPDFIRLWAWQNGAWQGVARERGRWPWSARIDPQMSRPISQVDYMDLEGDKYDVQGIDWEDLGVTRAEARERRFLTYKNYVNIPDSDRWQVSYSQWAISANICVRALIFWHRKPMTLSHALRITSGFAAWMCGRTSIWRISSSATCWRQLQEAKSSIPASLPSTNSMQSPAKAGWE